MKSPSASVISVHDDTAVVRVDAAPACARCQAGRGCGAGLLEGGRGPRELTLTCPPGVDLRPGDRVNLTLGPARLLRAALLAYGLPLAALLGIPATAAWLHGPLADAELAFLAAGSLAIAVIAGRRLLARDRCLQDLVPDIGSRLPADG